MRSRVSTVSACVISRARTSNSRAVSAMGEPPTVTSRRSGSSATEPTASAAGEGAAAVWAVSVAGDIVAIPAAVPLATPAPAPPPPTPEAARTASERFSATRIRANSSSIANGLVR